MMMRTLLLTLCFIFSLPALAQLSPPGLGKTNTAFWSAVGVKQKLDKKNSSTTYFGMGRISGAQGSNPFSMPSIVVVNQEFYHKLNANWTYSAALSYRRQHEYDESFDKEKSVVVNQEFRLYGRLQYATNIGNSKWTTTLRQEVRKFYTADFDQVLDGLQLRTRLKTQLLVPLDNDSENSLVGSAEALFAMTNDSDEGWGSPEYKESRFCLYYSYSPDSLPVTFDVGYMNDLIGYGHHISDVSYLAVDIIIENPF
ncbi:DUF2490 domain-containing protein [Flavobacterium cerinum]|uniref:DUF2490 domain-containing protein n=1 Tax=Flavobacterium cerinum TaxID=2502784 RepID=A0A444HCR2_9FLAO|nr:DUF2490 domain-containing protein [Flavobacterium cerinum]RWX01489.1 DUF2490 domain-containing protein [Flavobacterium cerinum]